MDVRTKLLTMRFRNNSFFLDLHDFIKEKVNYGELSYKNLKYVYKKMYRHKSLFIKQNLFPVVEFLCKGYTPAESRSLAKLLEDATDKTIFCHGKREKNYVYNKLFKDLCFAYNRYDYYRKKDNPPVIARRLVKQEIENTSIQQREKEYDYFEKNNKFKKDSYLPSKMISKNIEEYIKEENKEKIVDKEEVNLIKDTYPKGTKIKLINMEDEYSVPSGTIGVVDFVDDVGTIHMIWETGSSLGLIPNLDQFEIIENKKKNIKI